MPFFKSLATSVLSRRAGKRLGRVIPNPLVRYAVMVAATSLAPRIYRSMRAKLDARKVNAFARSHAAHARTLRTAPVRISGQTY